MTSPTAAVPDTVAVFVVVLAGAAATVFTRVVGDVPVTDAPPGVRADAVAVLVTAPASTSAWRTVYVARPCTV